MTALLPNPSSLLIQVCLLLFRPMQHEICINCWLKFLMVQVAGWEKLIQNIVKFLLLCRYYRHWDVFFFARQIHIYCHVFNTNEMCKRCLLCKTFSWMKTLRNLLTSPSSALQSDCVLFIKKVHLRFFCDIKLQDMRKIY